ncbi:MAG: cysteine desulfurase [Hyphomicrobiaceae bacterium]|nr:cysteine desulfurase [Hyphomicrobiaceae bacterium]
MSSIRTYLDHNATAPLRPEARAAMLAALDAAGNPSSVHAEGRRARQIVEDARERVAELVGARPAQVVFTSGATEANAWVLRAGWDVVMAGGIEHESVLAPARSSGAELIELPTGDIGSIAPAAVGAALERGAVGSRRALLALQLANNETGVVQPVAEAAALARARGVPVHTDAVQAAGRLTIDFPGLGADTLSLSAHKLGGPKGCGALVLRDGLELAPLIAGGGQERRRRAGTENVAGIAGFGAAAAAARQDLARMSGVAALRDRLEREALAAAPGALVIGAGAQRLCNTTCLALPGVAAETMVIMLDLAGIAVSAGAACSSGKVGASAVLAAMGLPAEIARSAIRVSLGWCTSAKDIDAFLAAWAAIAGGRGRQRAVA